ncbi:lycopene cyclase domain-containing protein [Microbacterium sp. USTB-Y]|uniref:lycopene cyclase domain-containing protein n=1 Tax=Microbacterium sp. USTB-Y TaxID=2823692 RepID=UPI00203A3C2C|nr:lycopene cyclase domain-containing protein [Microbacterium sp. USTB-Y]
MKAAYLIVDAVFLVPCVLVQALAWRRRPPGHGPALLATIVLLVALTVVFDSLMIAAGLFTYDPERISGIRIGLAPIEDLAYPLAAALLGTALWSLGRRAPRPAPDSLHGDGTASPEEARR